MLPDRHGGTLADALIPVPATWSHELRWQSAWHGGVRCWCTGRSGAERCGWATSVESGHTTADLLRLDAQHCGVSLLRASTGIGAQLAAEVAVQLAASPAGDTAALATQIVDHVLGRLGAAYSLTGGRHDSRSGRPGANGAEGGAGGPESGEDRAEG